MFDRIACHIDRAREIVRRYQAEMTELRNDVVRAQLACPHEKTEYNADPAGRYGGFTRCMECGAENGRRGWEPAPGIVAPDIHKLR